MLMTIPITAIGTVVALSNLPERTRSTTNHLSQWLPAFAVLATGGLVLAVQILGLVFASSRGPWLGIIISIGLIIVLVAIFVWRGEIGNWTLP